MSYSIKVAEYSPKECLIESCLEFLFTRQYGLILCGTHWVPAVVEVAEVVAEVLLEVEVVVEVVVVVVVVEVVVVVALGKPFL